MNEEFEYYDDEFKRRKNEMPLDDFHWHEAFDRTFAIMHMFNEMVVDHPVVQQNPEILALAGGVNERLYALYKLIADRDGLMDLQATKKEYEKIQEMKEEHQNNIITESEGGN